MFTFTRFIAYFQNQNISNNQVKIEGKRNNEEHPNIATFQSSLIF
jgi:hypothetical protein